MLEISVVVPTHNRAPFLEACLVSLCEQSLDPSRYEICVVANACIDNTLEVAEKIVARYPKHHVSIIVELEPGASHARNCALSATQAPLFASIDDDGTVDSNWLELFIARFTEIGSDLAIITGDIKPIWEIQKPEWLTPQMELYLSAATRVGMQPRFLDKDEPTCEGNTCWRRSNLEAVGGFPEELGRVGSCLLSGEHIVEERIRENGGRVFFDPRIILRHFIHADRLRPMWLRHRLFWQGVSEAAGRAYQIRQGLPTPNEVFIDLPLKPGDWAFMAGDTPEHLESSMSCFRSLGFVLALTGIMPTER
ncbi:MAG: glycosyltransferase family 2 protein [Alphaproteobacteria bacterium]|nr:glycosyltransferase family 2 protein [Alphaproteobacteria bacterium]